MTSKTKAPLIKSSATLTLPVDKKEKEKLETQMCKLFVQKKLLKTEKKTSVIDEYIRLSIAVESSQNYDTKKLELIHYARVIP